ncbi:hypothetical protein MPK74_gp038 [Erwinia phage pEa_SNUABM_7]|uniref:Uncharacterized protein n=1 Tax=Erwinia phage pEa_SNUABM_7 TaxID=2866695 RepID=A0AAE8BLT6_9CAUD|nr:hypothetical protein MPK74_gp038 [Erwinia phage pEa_SNUABM_7]QYW04706.1 hypothetical protein pEaSNUABM7_00038 [Erwinia phage pEa_SNUABM_7]
MMDKNLTIEFFAPRIEGKTVHVGPKPIDAPSWEEQMATVSGEPNAQMRQRAFDRLDKEFKFTIQDIADSLDCRDNPSSPTGRIQDPYRPRLHNINLRPEQAAVLREVMSPPRHMGGLPVELMQGTESSLNARALFEHTKEHFRKEGPIVTIDSIPVEFTQKGDDSIVIAEDKIGQQAWGRTLRIDYESRSDWSMNRTNRAATPAKSRSKLRAKGRAQKQARKRQRG